MKRLVIAAILLAAFPAMAQDGGKPTGCASCAAWNAPQQPYRVYGNTYYVGTKELSAVLIASDRGLILIDGDLPQSAPQIADHIRTLGFRLEDIKLILNSHTHFDHAGGIARLQSLSGAQVAASPWSAEVLRTGVTGRDDPQYETAPAIAPVPRVETIRDRQSLHVGSLAITAHFTPGHTPGGTSWTWQSCEKSRCLHVVYADSLTPVSADKYRFLDHPVLLAGFEKSFAVLRSLPCDILLTPHPEFSNMFQRLKARDDGIADAFVDPNACRTYVASARENLAKRLKQEESNPVQK